MLQYKVIYRPYDFSRLTGQRALGKGGEYGEHEADEWTGALNKYAGDGWTVRHSGTVNSERDIIFWALLEREVSEPHERMKSDSSTQR
jgi:hypothetical protein